MALNITQPAVQAIEATTASNGDPEVDELAMLLAWEEAQKDKFKEKYARLATLKKQFAERADQVAQFEHTDEDEAADAEVILQGEKFELQFGAKANNRKLADKPGFIKMIGQKTALELATFTIGQIDKLTTGAQRDKILTVERGGRSMKVVARGDVKS